MYSVVGALLIVTHIRLTYQIQSTCLDVTGHSNCELLPKDDQCGPVRHSTRVVGGKDASLGQFPWMALLYYRGRSRFSRLSSGCGGSIVTARHVISAAHCCPDPADVRSLVQVRVGEHDLKTSVDCSKDGTCAPRPQDIIVDRCIMHEEYNPRTLQNDISLIVLRKEIEFNSHVSPICLPILGILFDENVISYNTTLVVAGWGINKQKPGGSVLFPEVLQTLILPFVPRDQCQTSYRTKRLSRGQLCAGGVRGQDSCGGDSGGPLMARSAIDQSRDRYFLIGIVSFGPSPCGKAVPGVYVNASHYISWIIDNLGSGI